MGLKRHQRFLREAQNVKNWASIKDRVLVIFHLVVFFFLS